MDYFKSATLLSKPKNPKGILVRFRIPILREGWNVWAVGGFHVDRYHLVVISQIKLLIWIVIASNFWFHNKMLLGSWE